MYLTKIKTKDKFCQLLALKYHCTSFILPQALGRRFPSGHMTVSHQWLNLDLNKSLLTQNWVVVLVSQLFVFLALNLMDSDMRMKSFPFYMTICLIFISLRVLFGTRFLHDCPITRPLATPWSPWALPTFHLLYWSRPYHPSHIPANCIGFWNMGICGISCSWGHNWCSLMIFILKYLSKLMFLILYFSRKTALTKPSCHFRWSCEQAGCEADLQEGTAPGSPRGGCLVCH